jgi:cellulose synthase/poly-beta-1,6-N-acetylglucosamine synthase-like glycosyltransferase
MKSTITILIPAHNEEAGLGATLASLSKQTRLPAEVIVVVDNSTDRTEEIAREAGVTVLVTPEGVGGSKAAAQNYGLPHVKTDLVLPLDGDTTLDPDYLELLEPVFNDPSVAVASGCVLTQTQNSIWSKARHMEYLQSFHGQRLVQHGFNSVVVCSGCCSVFRVGELREVGGFPEGSLTEDIDYTLSQHSKGRKAIYVPEAVARAAEPDTMAFMRTQLKRWKTGHAKSVRTHYFGLVKKRPLVALWVSLQAAEIMISPLIFLMPILAFLNGALLNLLGWFAMTEFFIFVLPVLYGCKTRNYSVKKAFKAYPSYWALKVLNFEADMRYWIPEMILVPLKLKKPFTVYEKGH